MKPAPLLICLHIYIRRKVFFQRCMCVGAAIRDLGDLLGNIYFPKRYLQSSQSPSWKSCWILLQFMKLQQNNGGQCYIQRFQHTTFNVMGLASILAVPVGVWPLISMSFPLAFGNNHWFLNLGTKTLLFPYILDFVWDYEKNTKTWNDHHRYQDLIL